MISNMDNRLREIRRLILESPEGYLYDADFGHLLKASESQIDSDGSLNGGLMNELEMQDDNLDGLVKLMNGKTNKLNKIS